VLLSGTVLLKTPAVLLAMLFLADRLLRDARQVGWRGKLRLTGATTAGLLAVPSLMAAYYTLRGALPELLDALFVFPYHYARQGSQGFRVHARMAFDWTSWLLPWSAGFLILLGILRGILLRPARVARWALLFTAGLGTVMIQSKYFPYHHMILCPLLALGMSFAFTKPSSETECPGRGYRRLGPVLSGIALALSFSAAIQLGRVIVPDWTLKPGLARAGRWEERPTLSEEPSSIAVSSDVIRHIVAETLPEERIFVWGDEPWIYFHSNRRMAGPYCHLLLIVPAWGGSERLDALIQRLDRDRPRLIVVAPGDHFWRGMSNSALLGQYPQMREYIHDRYALAHQGVGYQIWKRTE
jgi:hypothetical protein